MPSRRRLGIGGPGPRAYDRVTSYPDHGGQLKPREVHHLHAHAPTDEEIKTWIGAPVTDVFGKSVGKVVDVYDGGDRIEWLLIKHRRSHHFLAPVKDAVGDHNKLFLPYAADHIEAAPEVDPGHAASEQTLAAAAEHYGLDRKR